MKKIINLSKVDRELDCFDNQNKQKTLIVVVSISGVYTRSMLPLLPKMSGEKILITANQDPHIALQFNQTIYLSKNNVTDDRFGLIGKYGITYFFDLVSENYIAKYRQ